ISYVTEYPKGQIYNNLKSAVEANLTQNGSGLDEFSKELYPFFANYDRNLVKIITTDGSSRFIDDVEVFDPNGSDSVLAHSHHALITHGAMHIMFPQGYDAVQMDSRRLSLFTDELKQKV